MIREKKTGCLPGAYQVSADFLLNQIFFAFFAGHPNAGYAEKYRCDDTGEQYDKHHVAGDRYVVPL